MVRSIIVRRSRAIVLALMTIVLWFAACPKDRQADFKPELNVFCVANPYGDLFEEFFVIDRTYAIDEEAVYDLEDALVVVSDSARSDTLHYIGGDLFGWLHNIQGFPRKSLRLMVVAEGLDTLRGETTVPGIFQVISPVPGDTFGPGDTLVLTKSQGALMYAICWDYFPSSLCFYFPDYVPDSIVEIPIEWLNHGDYPPQEGPCSFEIAAYDSNYAEYKMHWETNTYPRYGVSGGLGVFGSAYTKTVFFYYRP